jgi:hypothetical protein
MTEGALGSPNGGRCSVTHETISSFGSLPVIRHGRFQRLRGGSNLAQEVGRTLDRVVQFDDGATDHGEDVRAVATAARTLLAMAQVTFGTGPHPIPFGTSCVGILIEGLGADRRDLAWVCHWPTTVPPAPTELVVHSADGRSMASGSMHNPCAGLGRSDTFVLERPQLVVPTARDACSWLGLGSGCVRHRRRRLGSRWTRTRIPGLELGRG